MEQMTIFQYMETQPKNTCDDTPSWTKQTVNPMPAVPATSKKQSGEKVSKEFGQHIGGARKELWCARGLMLGDLDCMNAEERKKYVKKENVWKKPDYQKMIDKDMNNVLIVYIIKKIRDAVPSAPIIYYSYTEEQIKDAQDQYIEFVNVIKDKAMSIKTNKDALALKTFFRDNGYIDLDHSTSYRIVPSEKCHGMLSNKLYQAFNLTDWTVKQYGQEMIKSGFGIPAEDKLPAGYRIGFCNVENSSYKKDTYYVRKKYTTVGKDFATREEAFAFAKEHAKQRKAGKKAFIPPQLADIRRTGLPDVRNGRDIVGQDFLDDFHVKGGEFGEWMSEKDAQASLNFAYEAFCDMAQVLGITPDRISIGGELSIAFGARGHGNAVAHYEPERKVINITKMRGAGSLGHEMFHAIDDICGKKLGLGGMMTEHERKCPDLMKKVIATMQYRDCTPEENARRNEEARERGIKHFKHEVECHLPNSRLSDEAIKKRDEIVEKAIAEATVDTVTEADLTFIDALSDLRKKETGRVIPKENRTNLFYSFLRLQSSLKERTYREETSYYKESKRMDAVSKKDAHGYWSSTVEMFARAGACFLTDELNAQGCVSDYLSGHSESCCGMEEQKDGSFEVVRAMPQGEERTAINNAIRDLIEYLKAEKLI